MSDSIDDNQQQNVALLNITSEEGNENQPGLPDIPGQGELIEASSKLSTSTNSLQQQNDSFPNDKTSENFKNETEIQIEQDAKVVCY